MSQADVAPHRSPLIFFLLVLVLAIPFWVYGAVAGGELLPGLPVAALWFVCPGLAGLLLTYREGGLAGARSLLKRGFDFGRIKVRLWYAPILLTAPATAVLSFAILRLAGIPIPTPQFNLLGVLSLSVIFFIAAMGEELGWSGYAIEPMQTRWGPLRASLMLGAVWAVFHYPALMEAHRPLAWIAWWSVGTVATRVIMVWLYNRTGRSVFGVILVHMTTNLSWQLFPIHGSYFDPRLNGIIMAVAAMGVATIQYRQGLPGRP
jgi:uncharacterized protein